MPDFFFPCWIVIPKFEETTISSGRFAVSKRLWQTSTFDLATLATKHQLHLSYQMMEVLLSSANCELRVSATSREEAIEAADVLKVLLCINGVTPFVLPFVATHSVNDYSGINSRDSELLRDSLPDGLKSGLRSDSCQIEVWPNDLTLHTIHYKKRELTEAAFQKAAGEWPQWNSLEGSHKELRIAREALQAAPAMKHLSSSILQIWQGIESLFPDVKSELTFRLALLLAQLAAPLGVRKDIYSASRKSYDRRSAIIHGSGKQIEMADWTDAWDLLVLAFRAVLHRKELPTEKFLLQELLAP